MINLPPPLDSRGPSTGASTLRSARSLDLPSTIEIIRADEAADGIIEHLSQAGASKSKYRLVDNVKINNLHGEFENITFHGCSFTDDFKGKFKNCIFVMSNFDEASINAIFDGCSFVGTLFKGVDIIYFGGSSWDEEGKNFFLQCTFTASIHEKNDANTIKYENKNFEAIVAHGEQDDKEIELIAVPTRIGLLNIQNSVIFGTDFYALKNLDNTLTFGRLILDGASTFKLRFLDLPTFEVAYSDAVRDSLGNQRRIKYELKNRPKFEINEIDISRSHIHNSYISAKTSTLRGYESILSSSTIYIEKCESVDLSESNIADCRISALRVNRVDLRKSCLHASYARIVSNIREGIESTRARCEDFKRVFESHHRLLSGMDAPSELTRWYTADRAGRATAAVFSDDFFDGMESAVEEGRTPGSCRVRLVRAGNTFATSKTVEQKKKLAKYVSDEQGLKSRQTSEDDLILTDADMTGANLVGVDLSLTDLSGAIFDRADMSRVDLRGAIASQQGATPTRMNEARLVGARFAGALLDEASFARAALANATFSEDYGGQLLRASIRRANFSEATGLIGTEFTGLDLSGVKLPDEIKDFGALATIHTLSDQARNILFIQFLAAIYVVLTLLNLLQANETTSIILPVLDVNAPRQIFAISAGLILVATFAYLHSKLARIWIEVGRLPSMFPDQRSAGRHIYPFVLTSIVDWMRPSPRTEKSQGGRSGLLNVLIERTGALLIGWLMVPATLLAMLFLDNSGTERDTVVLRILLVISLVIAVSSLLNAYWKLSRTRNHRRR